MDQFETNGRKRHKLIFNPQQFKKIIINITRKKNKYKLIGFIASRISHIISRATLKYEC